jgi:FAD/FMN-containing dehydrogenase
MRLPSPLSQILISPLTDAVRRLPEDATAFPGRTGGRWLVHPVVWEDPARDGVARAWVDELTAAIRAHGETGTYLNLDVADDARIRWAMGEERYRRLQQVKRAWDPQDVFHHCTHIPLPA